MNEVFKKACKYSWEGISNHPMQSVFTIFTGIGVVFTLVSGTSVNVYIATSQIKANAENIQKIQNQQNVDMNAILVLKQIEQDNVDAQKATAQQLESLNNNFQQFLLNKIH